SLLSLFVGEPAMGELPRLEPFLRPPAGFARLFPRRIREKPLVGERSKGRDQERAARAFHHPCIALIDRAIEESLRPLPRGGVVVRHHHFHTTERTNVAFA